MCTQTLSTTCRIRCCHPTTCGGESHPDPPAPCVSLTDSMSHLRARTCRLTSRGAPRAASASS
eukprot:scaffold166975_cov33-Tisochrysis_lutea.AAC.3